MGEDEASESQFKLPTPLWARVVEVKVATPVEAARKSIVEDCPGLAAVLSPGAKHDIKAREGRCASWKDWGLISDVFYVICGDIAGQNRAHDLRDTKALPKGFNYDAVKNYYWPSSTQPASP